MAFMNLWLLAAFALVPPLTVAAFVALRGTVSHRIVAVQLGATIAVLMLMSLTMAVHQPSFLDLPLTLVVVSYPGTMIYTHFLERWL